jgi:hypothetical protein
VQDELYAQAKILEQFGAILLAARDESGVSQQRFYKRLIAKADQRFDAHLERIWKRRR